MDPTSGPRGGCWSPAVLALLAGALAFVVGTTVETAVIRLTRGNRAELEWLSDIVVSGGIVTLTYLWLNLKQSRHRLFALEREQVAVNEQLRLAAEIQRSALPAIPPATPGFRWAARMIPAGRVGGDFYDFCPAGTQTTFVLVADVSGKGIPAALLLSALKALFRTILRDTMEPSVIAERISEALFEEHGGVPYVTAIVARFDTAPLRVTYVNAGHPAAQIVRADAVVALPSDGSPLGLLPGARYVSAQQDLRPGDFGVMVTDGITEALETGPTTAAEAVRETWQSVLAGASLGAACDRMLESAARGGGPSGVDGWQDDRTVLVFAVE